MLKQLYNHLLHPVLDVLFPKYCVACDSHLAASENIICFSCKHNLPYTKMEQLESNEMDIRMITKLPLEKAAALLFFVEKGLVREMLHRLKYQNRPEVGILMGELLAKQFQKADWFKNIDAIVPIPLHPKRQVKRGYNQSEIIAQGIANITDLPILNKAVKRTKNTSSQTDKSRSQRLDNVKDAFMVHQAKSLNNKHILLLDDVFTTGATLSTCGKTMLEQSSCTLSLATLAIAHY